MFIGSKSRSIKNVSICQTRTSDTLMENRDRPETFIDCKGCA